MVLDTIIIHFYLENFFKDCMIAIIIKNNNFPDLCYFVRLKPISQLVIRNTNYLTPWRNLIVDQFPHVLELQWSTENITIRIAGILNIK